VTKIKTQPNIRHAFFDLAHGSRVRLSAASLTNPFLQQEVDHDPMPMDAYDGNSEQSRCDIVATNTSSKKTLSALVLALPALGTAHSCRAMSSIRGPLASGMMSSTTSALSNLITKPSALAAVHFDLGMP